MSGCIVCGDPWNGSPSVRVAGHDVCIPCVRNGIMPKFHAALAHEHNYPPTWGEGITLRPQHFLRFFDDPREFMQKWEEKKREYETPFKVRFYCAACKTFLCRKPSESSSFNVRCFECEGVTCFPCGADVTEQYPAHVCPPQPSEGTETTERFKGLERGKDYQICPNPECALPVELKEGCNHIVCTSAACAANFCFICGEEAGPNSGHWDHGKACSCWNHPDAPNAQYDNADLHARLRWVLGERQEVEDLARRMEMGDDENEEDDAPPFIDLLHQAIGHDEYERLVESAVGMMDDVPALPDLTGMTDEQQLQTEEAMSNDLESSPLGQLMLQHQHDLDAMLDIAEAHEIESHNEDLPIADWVEPAVALLHALRSNLDLYVYRVRLRTNLEAYEDRHDSLEAAYGRHQEALFAHLPRFYEILVRYTTVAEIRLLQATAEAETEDQDDAAHRRDLVWVMEQGWRMAGRMRERDELVERISWRLERRWSF